MPDQKHQAKMAELAKEMRSDHWSQLSPKQRLQVMQRVENLEAEMQHRPPATVSAQQMASNQRGYYSPRNNQIVMNSDLLNNNNRTSDVALKNVLHEGRHGLQTHTVNHPEQHPEIPKVQVREWENNMKHYVKASQDYMGYHSQPIEKDARAFSDHQSQEYQRAMYNGQSANSTPRTRSQSMDRPSTQQQSAGNTHANGSVNSRAVTNGSTFAQSRGSSPSHSASGPQSHSASSSHSTSSSHSASSSQGYGM